MTLWRNDASKGGITGASRGAVLEDEKSYAEQDDKITNRLPVTVSVDKPSPIWLSCSGFETSNSCLHYAGSLS
jgi:hypothetical protein